ncbi:cytochrome P450 [Xylariaceae sp. FL0594]|nr:cytochrome P450 [Xylariaceae sp. FL0594]
MPSLIILSAATLAATYILLRALAYLKHNAREPTYVVGSVPFITHLVGMLTQGGRYYVRMRFVVNSLQTLQRIDRHILTVAFSPIQARACATTMGVSRAGMATIAGEKQLTEDGYLRSLPRSFAAGTSPGAGLDQLNRSAIANFATSFDDQWTNRGRVTVKLYDWIRHELFSATTNAIYGPHNPFRRRENEEAWFTFESSIFTSLQARDRLVCELRRYFEADHHLEASQFVQLRYEHNAEFGLSLDDTARTEIGQVAAGIVNSVPSAFWMVWQVFSDPVVYADCRREVEQLLVTTDATNGTGTPMIDIAQVRTRCPILVSTWQEVMRFHGISTAARIVQEDTMVDDQFLLKKGGVVLMPNAVIHSDESLLGPTAGQFNHKRFVKGQGPQTTTRHPATAFRDFGGGHVLCPGRHFASTEILGLVALLLVRFDIRPVGGGQWTLPSTHNAMDRAVPLLKKDVVVELVPKGPPKLHVVFSDSNSGINIVAEDSIANDGQ